MLRLPADLMPAALASALFALTAAAQNAAPRPQLHVLHDVRLADASDAPRHALVLRDGRIESVLDVAAELPAGARVIDGRGMLALPAFVDAFTQAGFETPTPVAQQDAPPSEASAVYIDMRVANRKGIQPSFRAAEAFNLAKEKSAPWREAGFGALLAAPAGQLLAGTSALCVTRDAAARDSILRADVFAHAAFRAAGPGYPSTLIGYHAQLRQFFLDAAHHAELEQRFEQGRPGPRPAYDAELAAARSLVRKERRVMCEADSAQDIQRWIKLADELGFELGIVGGREAWKVAAQLKARDIPVVLTLQWGDEPKDPKKQDKQRKKDADEAQEQPPQSKPEGAPIAEAKPQASKPESSPDEKKPDEKKPDEKKPDEKQADEKKHWEYEEPLAVREAKRARWVEGRDCALRLHEAGVPFAFGSGGGHGGELLKKVRTLVEHGLPKDAALAALTSRAAQLVGAVRHLGALEAGADATLALWTDVPTKKDAKVAWLFIDGFPHEYELKAEEKLAGKPDEGVDASGVWDCETKSDQGAQKATLTLQMTPEGEVTGTLVTSGQRGERTVDVKGTVVGKTLVLEGSYTMRDTEVTTKWKVELDGGTLRGSATARGPWGETTSEVSGERKPKWLEDEAAYENEEACCGHK
ncbi:MAG: amidohydrolase family protein [Planctomycetes bacterium]|nr:amidohydrolase family protein [Planctomycetota bacterium]